MKEDLDSYLTLLKINIECFALGQFKVAYHALSGAFYYASSPRTENEKRIEQVRLIASLQLQELQIRFSCEEFNSEASEVALYRSLVSMADARRASVHVRG